MDMPLDAMNDQTDEALLAAFAKGEPAAARALTARLAPRVYAHAARLLGDTTEAEDVAQEAMLRLWRIAPDWRSGEAQVTTWLYRVTANLCTDRLRRRSRAAVDLASVPEPADDAASATLRLQDKARGAALQEALMRLPERQRQAVVLRHIEGLTNPEIARIMDIGPRAVESLTARGKRGLELLLSGRREELGFDDDD
ncbi:RNA polymerase sigma factor [Aestuariicoccus sp. MJ-SS9]|uniref:RNA polymerase sigma factor n=1 Tax=Aestuariicoccus sp. MJ-SS9 TaxID=3079855 RepID=UPI002913A80A|nr:RNA polymerase sigma factor [Aestuariicoccus sp. MJ-SS9]MDU8909968.1 RNA polymerase sigma factor [Aestuariicoccus sp. MJ-SS9]